MAQLTIVEHALCPLDTNESLRPDQSHTSQFHFQGRKGRRRTGTATTTLPLGLSPKDEFFLWGLLALTFQQPQPGIHFSATPHYCLRRLGVIDSGSNRGGKNYRLFRESLQRLAAVSYRNDAFYDPVRKEHTDVAFHLLSYRLPVDPESSRAWNVYWDPVFFEFCQALGGRLSFDLDLFRKLDPASRRLFLFLQKVFYRRRTSPLLDARQLAIDTLGFSPSLSTGTINRKLRAVSRRLFDHEVISLPEGVTDPRELVSSRNGHRYTVRFHRGPCFERPLSRRKRRSVSDSPLFDPLRSVGFQSREIGPILRRYDEALVREWTDITLAARERHGARFFKRSPQAYLIDNLKNASSGDRTPPDWWTEIRKDEDRQQDQQAWKQLTTRLAPESPSAIESETTTSTDRSGNSIPTRIGDILKPAV